MNAASARRLAIAASIAVGLALAPLAVTASLRARPERAMLCVLLAAIPAALLVFLRLRTSAVAVPVVVAGALARVLMLVPDEGLSDDVWRYRFDARVLLAGENPWRNAANSEALAPVRDATVWPRIAHPDLPCVYPPLAVASCALIEAVAPSTRAYRVAFLLADLAIVVLLVRLARRTGRSPALAAIWWLAPLVWLEVAGGGHFEPLAIAAALAAFLACERGKPRVAGLWLAAAVLIKPIAFVLLPCVVRPGTRGRTIAVALTAILLGLAPVVLGAGDGGLGGLGAFAGRWSANAPVFPALLECANVVKDRLEQAVIAGKYSHETNLRIYALDPELLARGLALTLCVLSCAIVATRRIDAYVKATTLLAFVLVFSPVVHPWYMLWCVAFVALGWSPGTFVWTASVVLGYHALVAFDLHGVAIEEPLLRIAQFLPVFAWWIVRAVAPPRDEASITHP